MEEALHSVSEFSYAVLGEGSAPALTIPGGPLLDPEYLGDMGGLTDHIALVVPAPPRVRVAGTMPVLGSTLNELGLDAHPTRSQAEALAGLFPHAEVVTLSGAGHYPWLDSPQAFITAVLAGLR